MQFRIKNRKDDISEYTEILNEQVLLLNQKTRDIGKEYCCIPVRGRPLRLT